MQLGFKPTFKLVFTGKEARRIANDICSICSMLIKRIRGARRRSCEIRRRSQFPWRPGRLNPRKHPSAKRQGWRENVGVLSREICVVHAGWLVHCFNANLPLTDRFVLIAWPFADKISYAIFPCHNLTYTSDICHLNYFYFSLPFHFPLDPLSEIVYKYLSGLYFRLEILQIYRGAGATWDWNLN